jgi:N-acylneuraminate cytidylyltransferase
MKIITAIIPARSKDPILENKNILPFGDSNLLTHKIRQLKKVDLIDEIIVTSESEKYLNLAKIEGVKVDLRPDKHSDINADFGDFLSYIVSKVETKHILWAPPTSPMIDESDFKNAINKYLEIIDNGYDSLITTSKLKRHLLDENGPLNFRFIQSKRNNESLPTLYEFTNGIVIAPKESILKWKYNWGNMPFKYSVNSFKSIDICDLVDYEFARHIESIKKK